MTDVGPGGIGYHSMAYNGRGITLLGGQRAKPLSLGTIDKAPVEGK
jgi:hypothetical protein